MLYVMSLLATLYVILLYPRRETAEGENIHTDIVQKERPRRRQVPTGHDLECELVYLGANI